MRVQFWGTRGSIPAPGPQTVKYGGNTSCVAVQTDSGTNIILDCGSGARPLGQYLMAAGQPTGAPLRLHLLVGHTHWDHIQGFPFFLPAFLPDTELNIFAPSGFQRNLEDSLSGQMQYSYFPVRLQELRSRLHFAELEEGFFRIGDVLVETQHLNHTNPTLAYRITADGASMVYSTDHEPFWVPGGLDFKHPGDRRHVAFLEAADLVIHDAQYTAAEYPERFGWGHSTWEYATDVAVAARARSLALFHHDPTRDDVAVARFEKEARRRADSHGSGLGVSASSEGTVIEVRGSRHEPQEIERSALGRRELTGKRVLLVGGSETESAAISREITEDGFVCSRAATVDAALILARQAPPDLVIVQEQAGGGGEARLVQRLRDRAQKAYLPVLFVADRPPYTDGQLPTQEATDYLARPLSPPMLRSRVRAWLSRGPAETDLRPLVQSVPAAAPAPSQPAFPRAVRMSRQRLLKVLASVSVFQFLPVDQQDLLSRRARVIEYLGGQEIIRRDEDSEALHVVVSGRVRVLEAAEHPDRYDLVLAELGAGEVFGGAGGLADTSDSTIVVAVEQTTCLRVPSDVFSEVVRSSPALAMALLRLLSGRIGDTHRRLARYAPDPLTGLARRRAFHDLYTHVASQARRAGVRVVLGLLDIVNLKGINDRLGYAVGDEVVRAVGEALHSSARKSDLVARYGGDEFVVLLVGARDDTMDVVAGRVRLRLAEIGPGRGIPGTIDCAYGVAIAADPPDVPDDLLLIADRDMQRRKAERRAQP